MKNIRIVITVLLVVIMAAAWFIQATGTVSDTADAVKLVSQGDKYLEKKLFQKAAASYEEAVGIKPDKGVYKKLMTAARKGYEDSVFTLNNAENMMLEACNQYPKDASLWEEIVDFSYTENDYKNAYSYLNKAKKSGVESDTLSDFNQKVSYTFTYKSKVYTKYFRSLEGYYTVADDSKWGILDTSGEWLFEQDYDYSSPIGTEKTVALSTEKDFRVYDKSKVVLAYLPKEIKEVKAIEGKLIPVKTDNGWTFYQYESEEYFSDTYENVSSFTDGAAAVLNDGVWKPVGGDGKAISDKTFDDVKLHGNGYRSYGGVMIASEQGKYGMYDKDCKKINDFSCKDADIYLGGAIAFADENGKWGFVNTEGKVVIEPQFDKAKSFSNNLAAVCKDGKWGFVDTDGKLVIDYQFSDADYFTSDGMAMVSKAEGQYITINLRFPEVLEEE